MTLIERALKRRLNRVLARGKSVLLLGPRQTGKTTLIRDYPADLEITLLLSKIRRQYEADPDQLIREVKALSKKNDKLPLIVIDEVQKVPVLMDGVQYLIDQKLGQFILTGSSARKLRHGESINLLPGRVIHMRLDPFALFELKDFPGNVEDLLIYGSLPAIRLENDSSVREEELDSYVELYLEEEVRSEALVRDIGAFENFLRLAAIESGNIVNFEKISQAVGAARSTIASYYQILEDCLIVERIEPFTESVTRKKLIKSPKYLFFDLGLRRLAAEEQQKLPQKHLGPLFEQFVGLELLKWLRLQKAKMDLHFWRAANGPEVDWIIKFQDQLLPIEVKWSDSPSLRDAKHLSLFMKNYPQAKKGLVVCRVEQAQQLSYNIRAVSWKELYRELNSWIEKI